MKERAKSPARGEAAAAGRSVVRGPSEGALWRVLGPLLVFGAAVALYALTLGHQLVWDDGILLRYVHDLVREGGLGSLLFAEFRLEQSLGYYRPVALVSLWADSRLASVFPPIYHATNVVLHGMSSALVCELLGLVTGGGAWAILGGLLFAAHPAHVESVAFVSGRTDLWAALFTLAATIFWTRVRSGRARSPGFERALCGLSVFLAVLSKEVAYLLPPVLLAWDALDGSVGRNATKSWWKANRSWVAVWASALGIALFLRAWAGAGLGLLGGQARQLPPILSVPSAIPAIWATYLRLLFVPWPLNAYYTAADLTSGWSLLLWVAAAAAGWAAGRGRARTLVAVCLLWFVAFLLPVAGTVPLRGAVVAERFLYLPSVALSFGVAGLRCLARKAAWGAFAVVGVWTALGAAGTLARSPVWRDNLTLFRNMVSTSPTSALVHNDLGVAYDGAGRREDALGEYRAAIRLDPAYPDPYYNMGNSYAALGRFADAADAYRRAIAADPRHARAHNNLGMAHRALGQHAAAAGAFWQALRIHPGYGKARTNLEQTCQEHGADPEVGRVCREAGWGPR